MKKLSSLATRWFVALVLAVPVLALQSCGSGGNGGGNPSGATRSFLMGSTPFFGTATAYPDWRFENMGDKDLLSLHVDDFWGVPWEQCAGSSCTHLPPGWLAKWQQFAATAVASGKTRYLAVSPLADRKTLAGSVQADGTIKNHWLAASAVDANGCYRFAEDATQAASYATAYVNYLKLIIDLVQPQYFSPAIEMNMPFTSCPAQKAAWVAWYANVAAAIKAAYPALIVFPSFQLEHMYGVADAASACAAGTSYADCFGQRLTEALAVPADRIALSTYPVAWRYSSAYGYNHPTDTFARIRQASTRKIWVSETGWAATPVRTSYQHASGGTCSSSTLLPATLATPAGTVDMANDSGHAAYMTWLLDQAQTQGLEAVVWWLNRDYLDGSVATTCPCTPSTSSTCQLTDLFYGLGASNGDGEMLLRVFGNMALRHYDGSPRPAYSTWKQYLDRPYAP